MSHNQKQTIDGIPRALLEALVSIHPSDKRYRLAKEDLRAMMDASASGDGWYLDDSGNLRYRPEENPAAQPCGDHMESGEFNDPLYNAESDARNAAALLEEVLEWFDDGVGRSHEEFRLMRRIGDWLGRSVAEIKDSSDECAHSEANKIGCPECGEVFK